MIAYPFRLLQCCLVTDGGGALILVAAERARDFPQKPVYLLGTGETVETPDGQPCPPFPRRRESRAVRVLADPLDPRFRGGDERNTSSRAFRIAGPKALAHPRAVASGSGDPVHFGRRSSSYPWDLYLIMSFIG